MGNVDPNARFEPDNLRNLPMSSGQSVLANFVPSDLQGLMEMSKLMAESKLVVPKHFHGNKGACFSLCMVAYQNGFNPWLLANDTYVVNEVLAYGAKAISAMVDASPRLAKPLALEWDGAGEELRCTCSGLFRGDPKTHLIEVEIKSITIRNSPLWKSQPRVQIGYYAKRAWARLYMPGVLLGMVEREEIQYGDLTLGADGTYSPEPEAAPPRPTRSGKPRQRTTAGEQSGTVVDVEPDQGPDQASEPAELWDVFNEVGEEVAQKPDLNEAVATVLAIVESVRTKGDRVAVMDANSDLLGAAEALNDPDISSMLQQIDEIAEQTKPEPRPAAQQSAQLDLGSEVSAELATLVIDLTETGGQPNWRAWYGAASNKIAAYVEADDRTGLIKFKAANKAILQRLREEATTWGQALDRMMQEFFDATD